MKHILRCPGVHVHADVKLVLQQPQNQVQFCQEELDLKAALELVLLLPDPVKQRRNHRGVSGQTSTTDETATRTPTVVHHEVWTSRSFLNPLKPGLRTENLRRKTEIRQSRKTPDWDQKPANRRDGTLVLVLTSFLGFND